MVTRSLKDEPIWVAIATVLLEALVADAPERGLTRLLEEVAQAAGCTCRVEDSSGRTLSRVERTGRPPTRSLAYTLQNALGTSVGRLIIEGATDPALGECASRAAALLLELAIQAQPGRRHEINNRFAAMLANVELLEALTTQEEVAPTEETLATTRRAASLAAEAARDLSKLLYEA